MPRKYLLHKTSHRVVPENPELLALAAKPDSEWVVVEEADALAILRDRTGAAAAAYFQRQAYAEAAKLAAIAKGQMEAAAAAASRPTPEEQAAAAAAAHAAGLSARLTDAEISVSLRDAGPTAVESTATPAEIASLPTEDPAVLAELAKPPQRPAPAPAPAADPAPPPAPAPAVASWGAAAAPAAPAPAPAPAPAAKPARKAR